MKHSHMLAGLLIVVSLLVVRGAAQEGSPEASKALEVLWYQVDGLRLMVRDLSAEVQSLERRVDVLEAMVLPAQQSTPTLVMQIEDIRKYESSAAQREQLRQLQKEIDALKKKAFDLRTLAGKATTNAEKNRLIRLAVDAEREVRSLEGEIRRLEKDWGEGHYWLLGWDGERDVMLWTEWMSDREVGALEIGDFLAWKGECVDTALGHPEMSDFATYRVTAVEKVLRPGNFAGRPLGREPVWTPRVTGPNAPQYPRLPEE